MRGLVQHVGCDQDYAVFGDAKATFPVGLVIFSDYHTCFDSAAPVDDGFVNPGILTDLDIGQDDTILDRGVGINLDVGK